MSRELPPYPCQEPNQIGHFNLRPCTSCTCPSSYNVRVELGIEPVHVQERLFFRWVVRSQSRIYISSLLHIPSFPGFEMLCYYSLAHSLLGFKISPLAPRLHLDSTLDSQCCRSGRVIVPRHLLEIVGFKYGAFVDLRPGTSSCGNSTWQILQETLASI